MRFSLTLLCGLILAPAAFAAGRATGDGVLELKAVNASRVYIAGKGAIWGQLDRGTLRVTDLNPDDNEVALVSGALPTKSVTDPGVTYYISTPGKSIHFRFTGARYSFSIVGLGIDLTAVGVGRAKLTGDPAFLDDGDYSVDDNKWQPVPLVTKLVTFGVQPVAGP
jgi:hypothetical protein